MIGFHSFCNASTSGGGGEDRADESEISEADQVVEDVVFERKRQSDNTGSSDGAGIGTESTISCPFLKAFARKGFRSSRGVSEKSAGPRVLRAS